VELGQATCSEDGLDIASNSGLEDDRVTGCCNALTCPFIAVDCWYTDAKQRCLPELHDVPYDTPAPSNSTSANTAAAAASVAGASGASSGVGRRTSHQELLDEPIYANAAAHPPVIGNSC